MSELVPSILFGVIIVIPIGVFIRQILQVRRGVRSKTRGTLRFFCFSLIPILVYAAVLLALIGIEEVTDNAVVSEGLARTFIPVVGIGVFEVVLLTGIFAIAASLLRPAK